DVPAPREPGRHPRVKVQYERHHDQDRRRPVPMHGVVGRHRPRIQLTPLQPRTKSEKQRHIGCDREHRQRPPRRVLRDHHPDPKPGANETNHRVGKPPRQLHRAGSRAPRAMSMASSTPSPATTNTDACTPEAAATVPPTIGPKANPRTTDHASNPSTVLWTSD